MMPQENRVYLKDFSSVTSLSSFINFSSDDEDANLEYLYNIGLLHAKRGNPRDAIFYFDKVLDVEPNHFDALSNKGNALGKLGKYDQAITCYDKILSLVPDNPSALYHKACTRCLQNESVESLALLEKAILLDSEYAQKASMDKDFSSLSDDSRFKALIS